MSNAVLVMTFLAFQNMENGYHILDRGNKVVLVDETSSRIIAYGDLGPHLASNTEAVELRSGFYTQGTKLSVPLKKFDANAKSGRGRLKICIPIDPKAPPEQLQCRNLSTGLPDDGPNMPNRHWQFDGQPVDYEVLGSRIEVTAWHGLTDMESAQQNKMGLTGGVPAAAVSFGHPIMSAALQSKGTKKDFQSPLVLDLDGDQTLNLIDAWDESSPIYFDINGDGTKTNIGWIGDGEGLLFIDRNGDGVVTDGRELFSEFSYANELEIAPRQRFDHGFAALAQFDHNADEVIDVADPAFKFMRVWIDRNRNAISEASEILSLKEAKVAWLNLAHRSNPESLHATGNDVRLLGSYRGSDGKDHLLADVWFRVRASRTIAAEK
jgi:hypothetical protein